MFKRILNFFLRDVNTAFRDNIFIMMIVVPIIIAIIIRFFIPTVETSSISFVVDDSVGQEFIDSLEDYGSVIKYDSYEKLEERVNGTDDVIGITKGEGGYVIVLEGNESGEAAEIASAVMEDILRGNPVVEISHRSIGDSKSLLREYFTIMIIFLIIFIQGMLVAFYIIEEKESGVINAIAVTPVRLWQYLFARWVLVAVSSVILSMAASLIIMGTAVSYMLLFVGAVFSSCLAVVVGFFIGGLASNQISGIAIMKVLNLVILLIPVAAIFVHDKYHYFFYPFPNYWVFRIFRNIYIGGQVEMGDFWMSCGIALILSVIFLIILLPFIRRRVQIR